MIRFLLLFSAIICLHLPSVSFSETITTPHFTVTYDGLSERYARNVADAGERNLARITQVLGHAPGGKVAITLTARQAQFNALTEGRLPDWSAAVALTGRRIVVSPLAGHKIEIERILAHELVHVIIEESAGDGFVPRWFHEGCAQIYSGEWGIKNEMYMVWKVSRGNLLTFEDIQNVFTAGSLDAGLAYDQSMIAVQRLISIFGPRVLPAILDGMSRGREFPQALRDATGFWPSEFEKEYLKYLRENYGPKTLLTLVPGTWVLIGVLFLVVYVIKRFRARKKLREWEAQEPREELSMGFNEEDDRDEAAGIRHVEPFPDEFDEEDEGDEPEGRRDNVIPFKPRPKKYD
ncbi:MAG: peptidase MA family metallohydrolase [Candidatus Latescibacter sp.]|nr:peptidase MA family metallohydrolase [Candidatus Latescibacter sp.]